MMGWDVFAECRERVSAAEIAQLYGFCPSRSGYICCPFHGEKTPSLKLYAGDRGWYCYGCHEGGDVIAFTSKLFGLDRMDAIRKLDADFSLGLPLDRPQSSQEREEIKRYKEVRETEQLFQAWRESLLTQLCAAIRTGNLALRDKPTEAWTDAETLAVQELARLEWWLESLEADIMEEQMAVFRAREGVERLCRAILSSTPRRSEAA